MTKEETLDWLYRLRSNIGIYMPREWNISMVNALDMAIKALEQEPCEDAVSREFLLRDLLLKAQGEKDVSIKWLEEYINSLSSATPQQKWIPVSERLPKELEPVNITWVNHDPESYYADIKDKPFTATGVYFNGQWYWWSTLCTDILAEYSHNYDDIINDDIEITAWMPLPKPCEPQESEDNDA